jgi:hypothetical protein
MGKDNGKQKKMVKSATVVIFDDDTIGVASKHRSGRTLKALEIIGMLLTGAGIVNNELQRLDLETPVDKARKHIIKPPPGINVNRLKGGK